MGAAKAFGLEGKKRFAQAPARAYSLALTSSGWSTVCRRLRLTKSKARSSTRSRPQAGFLIVQNNPIPSKNLPDSLAIPGVLGIPLSDGVQRHLISSDDEVGGQVGGQDGLQGEINE